MINIIAERGDNILIALGWIWDKKMLCDYWHRRVCDCCWAQTHHRIAWKEADPTLHATKAIKEDPPHPERILTETDPRTEPHTHFNIRRRNTDEFIRRLEVMHTHDFSVDLKCHCYDWAIRTAIAVPWGVTKFNLLYEMQHWSSSSSVW
jgi:hypothetical protein